MEQRSHETSQPNSGKSNSAESDQHIAELKVVSETAGLHEDRLRDLEQPYSDHVASLLDRLQIEPGKCEPRFQELAETHGDEIAESARVVLPKRPASARSSRPSSARSSRPASACAGVLWPVEARLCARLGLDEKCLRRATTAPSAAPPLLSADGPGTTMPVTPSRPAPLQSTPRRARHYHGLASRQGDEVRAPVDGTRSRGPIASETPRPAGITISRVHSRRVVARPQSASSALRELPKNFGPALEQQWAASLRGANCSTGTWDNRVIAPGTFDALCQRGSPGRLKTTPRQGRSRAPTGAAVPDRELRTSISAPKARCG